MLVFSSCRGYTEAQERKVRPVAGLRHTCIIAYLSRPSLGVGYRFSRHLSFISADFVLFPHFVSQARIIVLPVTIAISSTDASSKISSFLRCSSRPTPIAALLSTFPFHIFLTLTMFHSRKAGLIGRLFCDNNNGRNGSFFYVAGYLIEERRRWPVITASPRGQCSK